MKLDSHRPHFVTQFRRRNLDVTTHSCSIKRLPQRLATSRWVKLLQFPNPYSFDEALLLCQVSDDEWVAWIPDHGEVTLHYGEFSY